MITHALARARWLQRTLGFLLLLLALAGPEPRSGDAATAQVDEGAPLDLAAMILSPTDLAEHGLEGYLFAGGQSVSTYNLAGQIGSWTDQIVDDEIREDLEESGLLRGYTFSLRLREDPDDWESESLRDAYVAVHEFADADGAAAAVALADELSAESAVAERVEGEESVGDGSLLIRGEQYTDAPLLTLLFRVDRVIAVIQLVSFTDEEPEVADAEALAEPLLERIDAGLDADAPGLANHLLRLADDEYHAAYQIRADYYLRLGGEDLPLAWDTADSRAARIEATGDAVDAYELTQFVQGADSAHPELPYQMGWASRVYRFVDDEAAADWLRDRLEQPESHVGRSGREIVDLEVIDDAPVIGDESFAVAYTEEEDGACGCSSRVLRVYARAGAVVVDVTLIESGIDDLPFATIEALAEVQVNCLTSTDCVDPVLISDALAGRQLPRKHRAWDAAAVTDTDPTVLPAQLR